MNPQKTLKPATKSKEIKNKGKGIKVEEHNKLDEELKPLSFINKSVNQLNGVKGLYIEEGFEFKNVFTWNSSHVFRIYEADQNGERLKDNSIPFLYAIGKFNPCCDCQRSCGACCCKGCNQSFEMIITKNFSDKDETQPDVIFYVDKQNLYSGWYNFAQIYMNQDGQNANVGQIYTNSFGYIGCQSKYVNDLQLKYNICQAGVWCGCCCCQSCRELQFALEDADGNKGVLVQESTVCQWGFNNFRIGFPPNYNSDQNAMVLASCIFLAFESSNKKRRNESDSISFNRRRYF
ncbi:hypothetical protein ABPG72_013074 [Tetrahymena utriculariae]